MRERGCLRSGRAAPEPLLLCTSQSPVPPSHPAIYLAKITQKVQQLSAFPKIMRRELFSSTEECPAETARCGSVPAGPPAAPRRFPQPGAAGSAPPHLRGAAAAAARGSSEAKVAQSPPFTQKEISGGLSGAEREKRRGDFIPIRFRTTGEPGFDFVWPCLVCVFPRDILGGQNSLPIVPESGGCGSPRAAVPGASGASASRCARSGAALPAARTALPACAGGHEWNAPAVPGRSPRPHPPRAAQPRRCGEARAPHGHGAAAFPSVLDLGNRRLWAVNERPRGAARRGARRAPLRRGPGNRAERSAQGARRCPCRLPGGWGLPRDPRAGPLVISELLEAAWGELYFYLHIKRYRSH